MEGGIAVVVAEIEAWHVGGGGLFLVCVTCVCGRV